MRLPVALLCALTIGMSQSAASQGFPVGSVIAFAGEEIPNGWLLADGRALKKDSFPDLFAVLGVRHGQGIDSQGAKIADFNLPDLRGRFVRGVDDSPTEGPLGADKGASTRVAPRQGTGNSGNKVGSWEGAELASHVHTINDPGHAHELSQRILADGNGGFGHGGPGAQGGSSVLDFPDTKNTKSATTGISIQAFGGAETRPENIALYYLIRAKP